jgi:peptidoglycan/xylan/chitin deacetylase (PgdA/CDA1 family)
LAIVLARYSKRQVGLAVVFHRVGDPQGDPRRELVPALGTRLFERQLRHLMSLYRVVPATQLVVATLTRKRGERFPVAITFDDDLPTHTRVAAPILRRLNLPATFFVCGASLDAPFAFWWERLQAAVDRELDVGSLVAASSCRSSGGSNRIHTLAAAIQALEPERREAVAGGLQALLGPDPPDAGMRSSEVLELDRAGFEIGFHTRHHHFLPQLDDANLREAMTEGRDQVAGLAKGRITMLAYPHGGADSRVAVAARSAGYEVGFTGSGEAVTQGSDPLLLGRLEASFASLGHFAYEVARSFILAHLPRERARRHEAGAPPASGSSEGCAGESDGGARIG